MMSEYLLIVSRSSYMYRDHNSYRVVLTCIISLLLCGCPPIETYQKLTASDRIPPTIDSACSIDSSVISIICSEPVSADEQGFLISPGCTIASIEEEDTSIFIHTDAPLDAGVTYTIEGVLSDAAGNHVMFSVDVFGWNPSPPVLLINEFTTKGSSRHPDAVELIACTDGNTAGICLYDGVPDSYRQRCILPSCEVSAGDLLVIHCTDTPESLMEVSEAVQFIMEEPCGLSANNGVLSLFSSPYGQCMDAVIYSNRYVTSDTRYGGFGSAAVLHRASHIGEIDQWRGTGSGSILPEDAVRSDTMTATRTTCRQYPPVDTDCADDWHIVPTSCASFGLPNCSEVYAIKKE